MAFSQRAQRLLEQGRRRPCPIERDHILAALQQVELPVFEPIVAFQQRFGGIAYHVKGTQHSIYFNLFHKYAPLPDISVITDERQRYFFECAEHSVAPVCFYLGEEGTMYVDDCFAAPVAIASSVEKYIESDALVNELSELHFTCWSPLGTIAAGENESNQRLALLELPVIEEASDPYTTWWGNDRMRVVQRVVWADGPAENQIVAYARTPLDARQLLDALRDLLPAHSPALGLLTWPMV
jgi:hypothetical protein